MNKRSSMVVSLLGFEPTDHITRVKWKSCGRNRSEVVAHESEQSWFKSNVLFRSKGVPLKTEATFHWQRVRFQPKSFTPKKCNFRDSKQSGDWETCLTCCIWLWGKTQLVRTCVTLCTRQSSAYVPLCIHGRRSKRASFTIRRATRNLDPSFSSSAITQSVM